MWALIMIGMGYQAIRNSHHAGLLKKHYKNFLSQAQEHKANKTPTIILVGCSNVALGVDPDSLSSSIGFPVINLALYRNIGMEIYAELLDSIYVPGDIVLLSVAYGGPTFSMDGAIYRTINGMLTIENVWSCVPFYLQVAWDKISDGKQEVNNVSSFSYANESNIDERNEFIGHKNVANRHLENFSQKNQKLIASYFSGDVVIMKKIMKEKRTYLFHPSVAENFDIIVSTDLPFITDQKNYRYSKELMFDNRFHLNWEGRFKRTGQLANDLKPVLKPEIE